MTFHPSAVSAPGKVLLAGGYLVLSPEYSGLVFALSARIHCVSRPAPDSPANTITVLSPQFSGATWTYTISASTDPSTGVHITQSPSESKNPFVETTLRYALTYLNLPTLPSSSTITIYADNDYYSQPSPSVPRFNTLNVPITEAHKTGLGSSAALVTSLTACLLSTYGALNPSDAASEMRIHNLAQAAHCAAQGKVGSGFDVAAAVFGSCVYHRFTPSVLEEVGGAGSAGFAERLRKVVESTWDLRVEKRVVPPGLRIVMGDVDCGSSTPGMVKKVLAWRKEKGEEAEKVWRELEAENRGLINLFDDAKRLAEETRVEEWKEAVGNYGKGLEEAHDASAALLRDVSAQIRRIREKIRKMGEEAGVEIEPASQTRLLDGAMASTRGVLGGVVPGAGGYDAVVFIMTDEEETVNSLRNFLKVYQFQGDGSTKVTALETREEHQGVRLEDINAY